MIKQKTKAHNQTKLIFHIVTCVKYRKNLLTKEIKDSLINVCMQIEEDYEIEFHEIGTDQNHVHYLVQLVPKMSVSEAVRIIKSITGRIIFKNHPSIKQVLRKGQFWSGGYWACTVGQHMSEKAIREYVKNQGYNQYQKGYDKNENRKF